MLVYLKNWNIIKCTNNGTSGEDFDDIHNIELDGISNNMDYLSQIGKYGGVNKLIQK